MVVKTLGRGSYGKVKLCLNTLDGQLYAIKARVWGKGLRFWGLGVWGLGGLLRGRLKGASPPRRAGAAQRRPRWWARNAPQDSNPASPNLRRFETLPKIQTPGPDR